jgi:prolyl oligopeptidase
MKKSLCFLSTLAAAGGLLAADGGLPAGAGGLPAVGADAPAPASSPLSAPAAGEARTPNFAMTDQDDPFLWLEDVSGDRALAWVRAQSARTEGRLEADPAFAARRDAILEVLDSKDQIPHVSRRGAHLYNLWQDAANPRGLWRRTTLAQYRQSAPAWEVLLDLDALAKAEGESWVWGGARCLPPLYRRCLLSLSRGGADAVVLREFDLEAKRFVPAAEGGFELPESKLTADWLDADTIVAGVATGPGGAATDSGYPRQLRRWARGTPFEAAPVTFEVAPSDLMAAVGVDRTPGFERIVFWRSIAFYRAEVFVERGLAARGGEARRRLAVPEDAEPTLHEGRLFVTPRSPWAIGGTTHPAGALIVGELAAFERGEPRFDALFTPTPNRSLQGTDFTRSRVVPTVLQDVATRIEVYTPAAGAWVRQVLAAPFPATLSVAALHDPLVPADPLAEHLLLNHTDFLTPDSLHLVRADEPGATGERLKARTGYFDAAGMRAEQRFATSRDGTRVPYFVVWPRGAVADGRNPTLLYGYGGFEVSMQPWYSGSIGRTWGARGGVYVLANIRGGGEYGPAWHQAALTVNRQRSFDDFIAVAEDLVRTKVTSPAHLGIEGGSNGGLLVGAVMLQRPELFGAVVCQVPLLDMRRYTQLLAGESWKGEYGDPGNTAEWAALAAYSPYQNVRAAPPRLPPVLFVTSTRDDRVHPGHARKMAARMQALGHDAWLWENTEGGHGGAADHAQRARMQALEWTFLWQQLAPK